MTGPCALGGVATQRRLCVPMQTCLAARAVRRTGLIAAAPSKHGGALHDAAQQVEAIVRQKMRTPEYIILCLEDASDWSNATTRRIVMSVRGARRLLPFALCVLPDLRENVALSGRIGADCSCCAGPRA